MKYDPTKHHRRSIRLKGYDYSQPGAYFFTICTHQRQCTLGHIEQETMHLNAAAQCVLAAWHQLPERFPSVQLDAFVIMPNHIHGIFWITQPLETPNPVGTQFIASNANNIEQGAMNRAPTNSPVRTQFIASNTETSNTNTEQGAMNRAPTTTVGQVLRVLKAVSTRHIRQGGCAHFAWQTNYYEHIIRHETALMNIRHYIAQNPARWAQDKSNPAHLTPH